MIDIEFLHSGKTYNYREKQPCQDGLYVLIDKTFVLVENVSLELTALINNKIASYNLDNYKELRKKEYEKLNQLEMQYDDLVNNTTTWQDKISEIKSMYPKPTGV